MTFAAWSSPDASNAIAVGARTRSSQPASPETTLSMTTPRWTNSIAVSGQSAGVGPAGPSRRNCRRPRRARRDRGRANGGMTSSRRLPPPVGGRRGAVSGRALGAWRRGVVPWCRGPRRAAVGRRRRAERRGGTDGGRCCAAGPARAARQEAAGRRRGSRPAVDGAAPGSGPRELPSRSPSACPRPASRRGPHRNAARASLVRARPLAASIPSAVAVRGRSRPTSSPDPTHPAARRDQLAPPERHPAKGDVERPEQQRQDQQHRPQVGEPVGGRQVVPPRVERGGDDRPAGRRPKRGEERLVGAELPVLGRGLGDQPDRPTERRRARPGLGHPDGVRPRLDLAERRLVDPGRDLDQADGRRLEVGPDDARARRVEVARRPVRARRSRRGARSRRRSSRTSPRCRLSPRPGRSS